MSNTDRDTLADRLEDQFDSDVSPDTARGQVFHGIGYIMADADPEVAEALDVLSDKLKEA